MHQKKPLLTTQAEKVVIKVNKFVHPVYQLPQIIDAPQLARWRSDYTEVPGYKRIREHLMKFDETFFGLFVGGKGPDETKEEKDSRIIRFQKNYLNGDSPQDDNQDEDEDEFNMATKMFYDDVTKMRNLVADSMI